MSFIQTFTGKKLDLLNPTLESICIEDICHGLTYTCRFASQCKFFYSVCQHSIMACGLAPKELKLEALLHDAAEAYTGDISFPLKKLLKSKFKNQKDFSFIENELEIAIETRFDLYRGMNGSTFVDAIKIIREIDSRLAITEEKYLMKNQWLHGDKYKNLKSYDFQILPMTFEQVREKFMGLYEMYKRD